MTTIDTSKNVLAQLLDLNPDAVLFENLDSALIAPGLSAVNEAVAVYSRAKIYSKLMRDGMSLDDANEYFISYCLSHNYGKNTPIIIDDLQEG
ncbi:hypothetical protein EBZ39_03415 [bacterium]|nr:hypothetical protein [bacterium]